MNTSLHVTVKVLIGYPTKKVSVTCQEISNLRQESVKGGLLDCPVRLGLK